MASDSKNIEEVLYEAYEFHTRPKEKLTVSEWATRYRWFAHGQSFKSQYGNARYNIDDAPFQREPQDELTNPKIFAHVWKMASRIAKTVMMGNGFGYFSEYDPTTQLFMYPTQEDADQRSRDEFQPIIDVSPMLRGKYIDVRGGSGDNTISFKKFTGGSVAFVGSNAPSKLRARTARVIWCDEANGYRPSSGKEGDPMLLAFNRAKNYPEPVRVVASTDTIKNHSRIEEWFEKSDKRFWFVPCVKCGVWQFQTWKQYRWPGDERWKCQWVCDSCQYGHNDRERRESILAGEYRPTAPETNVRGYFLPGYYSIFPSPKAFHGKMHEMAEEAHNAKHSQNPSETIRVWVNTFLCEGYQEETDITPDWRALFDRRENYSRDKLPNEISMITFGTDFQADRIEVVFWGHGKEEQKWRIEKHVLNGDPRMPEMYGRLEALLLEPFKRVDGAQLKVRAGGFDTGYYACIRQLYEWIRPRQRFNWFAFKGASQLDADPVAKARLSRVTRVTLLLVGTHKIKSLIYNRANISNPGPGYIHFSYDMKEEDFAQLFSEESRSVFKEGRQFKEFSLPSTGRSRNEELDCAVLAHAALYARGHVNYDFEEKHNLATIGINMDEVAQKKKEARMAIRKRNLQRPTLMRGLRANLMRGM